MIDVQHTTSYMKQVQRIFYIQESVAFTYEQQESFKQSDKVDGEKGSKSGYV